MYIVKAPEIPVSVHMWIHLGSFHFNHLCGKKHNKPIKWLGDITFLEENIFPKKKNKEKKQKTKQ